MKNKHLPVGFEELESRITPNIVVAQIANINLNGNSDERFLTEVNNVVFFRGSNSSGGELWRSNSTSSGTFLIRDIAPGSASSNPLTLTNVNGVLFFAANDGVVLFHHFNHIHLTHCAGFVISVVSIRHIAQGT